MPTGEAPIEDAELWIAGMPKMDISALRARRPRTCGSTRASSATRSCPPTSNERTSWCSPTCRPTSRACLFTALRLASRCLLSDVGGFPEMASTGAARVVPAGDARALGRALRELLADTAALSEMCGRPGQPPMDVTPGSRLRSRRLRSTAPSELPIFNRRPKSNVELSG